MSENQPNKNFKDRYYHQFFVEQDRFYDLLCGKYDIEGIKPGLDPEAVKKRKQRNSMPSEEHKYYSVWLLMGDFFQDFFDLGLSHREHHFNNRRLADQKCLLMELTLWSDDPFWTSFLKLYRWKEQKDSKESTTESVYFQETFVKLSSAEFHQFKEQEVKPYNCSEGDDVQEQKEDKKKRSKVWELYTEALKTAFPEFVDAYTELKDKALLIETKLKDKALLIEQDEFSKKLELRFQVIAGSLLISTMLTWVSQERKGRGECTEEHRILLSNSRWLADFLINRSNYGYRELIKPFLDDLYMVRLLAHGNSYLYGHSEFKTLPKEEQEEALKSWELFKSATQSSHEGNHTILYQLWWEYYEFFSHQRTMQKQLQEKKWVEARNSLENLLRRLEALEELAKIGFLTMSLKIKKLKRSTIFFLYSLDAYLKSKEIGEEAKKLGSEIGQLIDEKLMNATGTYQKDFEWWKEIEKNLYPTDEVQESKDN